MTLIKCTPRAPRKTIRKGVARVKICNSVYKFIARAPQVAQSP